MKKVRFTSLLLCVVILVQCLALAVSAAPVDALQTVSTEGTESTEPAETTLPVPASDLPFGQLSIQNGCRTIEGMMPLGGAERRLATAQGVFAFEMSTGTVVYSYNPDVKLSPGTLAKIMTALLTVEYAELDEVVTCAPGIQSKIPGGSQNVKLKSEEELTVEDLLHCLLLQSANDAAVALAEHVGGTRANFVTMMNARAKQLGCTGTEFGNISGLDTAVSTTTARDMAKIYVEAISNPTFAKVIGTAKYTVPATNVSEKRDLVTTNYMIDNSIIPQFLDDKVKGGLASYSEASGANLVCNAEYKDMKLVCVVLGALRVFDAEQTWKATSYGNFNEMQELLEYIYSGFKVNQILYDGQALTQFQVIDGESDVVGKPVVNYKTVLPANCNMDNLYMEYNVVGKGLTAPIKAGQMISTVAIKYRNSYVAEAELYAMNNVYSASNSDVSIRSTAQKAEKDMDGVMGFLGVIGVIALGGFGVYVAYNALRRTRRRIQRRRRRASRRRNY